MNKSDKASGERLNEKLQFAKKALAALNEALILPYSKIIRDAAIQRLKCTLESLWKLAQRFLILKEGLEIGSPKGVIRGCFQVGLLNERQTHVLLQSVDDRNLSVHTYNEDLAEQIYQHLLQYQTVFNEWYLAIKNTFSTGP